MPPDRDIILNAETPPADKPGLIFSAGLQNDVDIVFEAYADDFVLPPGLAVCEKLWDVVGTNPATGLPGPMYFDNDPTKFESEACPEGWQTNPWHDIKSQHTSLFTNDLQWDAAPSGAVYWRLKQVNFIVGTTADGMSHNYEMTTRTFDYVKVDNNTWGIRLGPTTYPNYQ